MYATKSLTELKAIALELNVTPTGDKRSKQTWIDAIESAQSAPIAFDTEALVEDVWVAPEMPSETEQEIIAHAVDTWIDESALEQTAKKVLNCKSNKPGAAIVISALVCIAILFCHTRGKRRIRTK